MLRNSSNQMDVAAGVECLYHIRVGGNADFSERLRRITHIAEVTHCALAERSGMALYTLADGALATCDIEPAVPSGCRFVRLYAVGDRS